MEMHCISSWTHGLRNHGQWSESPQNISPDLADDLHGQSAGRHELQRQTKFQRPGSFNIFQLFLVFEFLDFGT